MTLTARAKLAVEMKRLKQDEMERYHHSKLLHDILPAHIVESLIAGDKTPCQRHDQICMLFSDIVGW